MYDQDGDYPFEGLAEVLRLSLPNLKTLGNASRSHAFVVSAFTSCLNNLP